MNRQIKRNQIAYKIVDIALNDRGHFSSISYNSNTKTLEEIESGRLYGSIHPIAKM